MSHIEKMRIQGIRSFGNQLPMNIVFTAPLTLIVGWNGSGKTTIIECLKYASTGQLPPNSKGGAFVHDPKLAGEKEVMAQVKLQFRNASGNRCTITRSLQLTVKKATTSLKTLECQLMMVNGGERISLSTRVAELDKIVPEQLGVSPAILENVIFCHQDESLWPMSEPSKLKVKFDEIFEAQKYTKAIDNLNQMRKDQATELGKLQIHEGNFKQLKDKADRAERKMTAISTEIDELRDREQALKKQIQAADALSKEKHEQKNEALGIVNELRTKIQQSEGLESFLVSLRENLDELEESDDWLATTLAQYEERMQQYEQQEAEYQRQWTELQAELKASRRQVEAKQAEKGQHQAQKESYERSIQSRIQLVKEAARTHGKRGYDGDLEEHQIREFVNMVQKLSRDKDIELDQIRKTTNDELKQTQSILSDLDNKQATRTQEKVNAKQAIAINDRKSKLTQNEVDSVRMDEGVKAALDTSLRDTKDLLATALAQYETANWDGKLKRENTQLQELETEEKRLKQELFQSTKLSKDLAALEFTKKTAKEQQSALDVLVATYNDQFTELVGPNWRPTSLRHDFNTVIDRKNRSHNDAKTQQAGADRELSNVEFKLKTIRSTLKEKREEMQKCESIVLGSITADGKPLSSIDTFPEELRILDKDRDEMKNDLEGINYISKYYTEALDVISGRNCCRLCQRSFEHDKQKTAAKDIINKLLQKYDKRRLEEDLKDTEKEYQSAHAAQSKYDMYRKLHDVDIPSLENSIKKIEGERSDLLAKCEQLDNLVKEEASAKQESESFANTVNSITNYHLEISKNEVEIERLSSQQKLSGSSMTITEIKEQSEICDDQIRTLKQKIAKMSTERDQAMAEINRLEREESAASKKVDSAAHQLEKKQGLLAAIEELRESSALHRQAIQHADAELTALGPQFSKARTQHEDAQRRGHAKSKDVQAEKDKLAQTVNKFKLVEDSINAYIDNDGPGKLADCEREIKSFEQDQKRIDGESQQVTASHNEVKKRRADSERTKRSIVDNIRFRRSVKELETVKAEIAELESRNATEDYEQFHSEALAADHDRAALQGEVGPIVGSIRTLDKELGNMTTEWETDYKDATNKYREMHVRVETTKAAIDDLKKCSGALDNAIMKYHSMKMEEINAIASELWRSTYQGTDVDSIMIRSENESPTAKKRNYNYRVVMVKQDAEMDMRGRCSAGQKVLASIIIRLALAECFGINCGVIALDEPTTNLDRDNIKALAESLNRIIKTRRHQSNFQLIIITHDEDFLREMKVSEFVETYFRVSRNADQKSVIDQQSLDEIM